MVQYVTHEDAREMMREHMRNLDVLKACKRHRFSRERTVCDRFCCESCGGLVTDDQRRWYEQGVEHGQQNGHVQQGKTRTQK
jgi:hypothetical protein